MVPRNEIVAMEIGEDINKLTNKFVKTVFPKFLILEVILIKLLDTLTLMNFLSSQKTLSHFTYALVPETMTANEILNLFIKERKALP